MQEADSIGNDERVNGFRAKRPGACPVVLQLPGEPYADLRCERAEGHQGPHRDYGVRGLHGPAEWDDGELPWRDGWQFQAATAATLILGIAVMATCGSW